MTGAYADAVAAVQAADHESAMERAAAAGCTSMEAVPTLEQRIAQVTDGWRGEYRQALARADAGSLTEADAAVAAELARQALEGLERLGDYSTLRQETERKQVAGQAAVLLEAEAENLQIMEKAGSWLISLDGLSMRELRLVQAEEFHAYQSAISHYHALEEAVRGAVSGAVLPALELRQNLAGVKRSEALSLQEFYDSLDLSLYSAKGQAALAIALQEGLESIGSTSSADSGGWQSEGCSLFLLPGRDLCSTGGGIRPPGTGEATGYVL